MGGFGIGQGFSAMLFLSSRFILILLVSQNAFAQSKEFPVQFTRLEIKTHKQRASFIAKTSAECLQSTYAEHVEFFKKWGISKFYGELRPQHRTYRGLKKELKRFGKPQKLIHELRPTACVSLALSCLGKGFAAANMQDTWKKIFDHLQIGGKVHGTDLQIMLRMLGWRTLYFNPDPVQNRAWDEEDKRLNPLKKGKKWNASWGGHSINYNLVLKHGFYNNRHLVIDDAKTLVGFKKAVPASFKRHEFFIGTAHSGFHVFPGFRGFVIEAHGKRALNDFENLEAANFNPLDQPKGAPRWSFDLRYRSGVIVVPPLER